MLAQKSPQIEKAYGVLKELSHDERTRLLYEEREKARRDNQARFEGAYEKGLEKGLNKKAHEIALNALQFGMNVEDIVKLTGLTLEEIETLSKEIK